MKLWEKGIPLQKAVESFTTGKDREMDLFLAPHDVAGSMAHALMLGETGILSNEETEEILKALGLIYAEIRSGNFRIEDGIEDVHSQVEALLTLRLGDPGKKIHTGRSRNDQVLLDIRLFTRDQLRLLSGKVRELFALLLEKSEEFRGVLMPGYTHMQVAMPSSFGLWLGSFAESLTDDMRVLEAAYYVNDQNPLGTAAGYGSSFPVDRERTTRLLGFSSLCVNSIYAQGSRGKTEWVVASALASLASTLGKLAMDCCLFMGQDFGFLSLPDDLTTGSSIMPHKKNPDVFELIRARSNRLKALPGSLLQVSSNLPSGYQRDFQLIKEMYLPAFAELDEIIEISMLTIKSMQVKENLLEKDKYVHVFSVEEVNRLVREGLPFREAYRKVAAGILEGTFQPEKEICHTHTGSVGNPGTALIREKMEEIFARLDFSAYEEALKSLLEKAGVK